MSDHDPGARRTQHHPNDQLSMRITSNETAEDRQRKDRQRSEMQRALMEQVQEKERLKKAQRERELEEDRKQEARMKKQQEELREEYRREAGEAGGRDTGGKEAVGREQGGREAPRQPAAPKKRARTPEPLEVEVRPSNQPAQPGPSRLVYVKELWRETEELNQKQSQLQQMISDLKEQAGSRKFNPTQEFETMRKEILGRQVVPYRSPSEPWTSLRDSSRFVSSTRTKPFAQVGHRLVTFDRSAKSLAPARPPPDYSMVESAEIRNQLDKLDGLLDFCKTDPMKRTEGRRLEVQRLESASQVPRDSPELQTDAQSVPLTFSLSPS